MPSVPIRRLNAFALTAIRERSGMRKIDLARAAEITPSHVTDLEAGRRQPSPELLARLAVALKVPLLALMLGPDREQAS